MAKTKINKLILILMLIIMAFCFCACGSVNSIMITNEDNTIDEFVVITLVKDEIEKAGYNFDEVKEDVRVRALLEIDGIIQKLNTKVSLDLLIAEDDKKEVLNTYYNGITAIDSGWNGSELKIGIKFKSKAVYNYFYNIAGGGTSSKPEIEEHFFYSKYIYKGSTLYYKHRMLYQTLKTELEAVYPDLVKHEQGELLYTYVSELRRQHSDADYINYIDGKYYHTWKLDSNNPNKIITIHYNILNRANCILVAVAGSFIVLAVLCGIGLIITKKNKSKNN